MLVIDVGVKFRTVSVKCANIFDQDCLNIKMNQNLCTYIILTQNVPKHYLRVFYVYWVLLKISSY